MLKICIAESYQACRGKMYLSAVVRGGAIFGQAVWDVNLSKSVESMGIEEIARFAQPWAEAAFQERARFQIDGEILAILRSLDPDMHVLIVPRLSGYPHDHVVAWLASRDHQILINLDSIDLQFNPMDRQPNDCLAGFLKRVSNLAYVAHLKIETEATDLVGNTETWNALKAPNEWIHVWLDESQKDARRLVAQVESSTTEHPRELTASDNLAPLMQVPPRDRDHTGAIDFVESLVPGSDASGRPIAVDHNVHDAFPYLATETGAFVTGHPEGLC